MSGKIIQYFAGGNTARGFYSLFDSNLQKLDRIFILKGGPGTGKSTLMKEIGKGWCEKGYNIEYLHCSSDPDSIDGVIIPSLCVGVVDGTAPHVIEPKIPGAVEEYVNLGEAWNSEELASQKNRVSDLSQEISDAFQMAYNTFAEALRVHDKWEKIYIESMDFEKADELTNQLIGSFYGKVTLNKQSKIYHRFLGAATPIGAVDFVPNLTSDLHKRYFIKGRPGSGKSTMLKKIAAEGEKHGFDLEVYHCGFDPHSLDMIIIRELSLAIFDSTAPHEYFPSRDGDEIIDMYGTVIDAGTDEIFADQIEEVRSAYKAKMDKAIGFLAKAKSLRDELEAIYVRSMDFTIVDKHKEKIQKEILRLSELQ
ncbi:PRK06851 family protein [Bacillus sp. V3B]|uniref:PRK06851 family protein n=1 Tax=Bacillus sp. V3B TaxID=2804915 RepID=UPI00210A6F1A|nr:PRK06851 family protein [Bacillus sp. V3B]MCQ6274524.1 PRK06851 family protein [Bacillus sp. V3B]